MSTAKAGIITCECERGPRETICHTDDAGVESWKLADYCSDCYEDGSCFVRKAEKVSKGNTALPPTQGEKG